jgi:integrase
MPNLAKFKRRLKEQERAENTVRSYCVAVEQFFKLYKILNEDNIRAFRQHIMERFKASTVNHRLNALSIYAKFLGKDLGKIKLVKIQKQICIENVISKEEFTKLCEGLKNDGKLGCYWLVMFLAKTGARVNEFVRLTKACLDKGYEELYSKGKIRRIYIPSNLIAESKEYFLKVDSDYLFPSRFKSKITTRGIAQKLQDWGLKYGIRKEVMHPHSFRHFYAKNFLANGGDLVLLSDLLGHSRLETTAIYLRKSSDEMAVELSRIMSVI